MHLNLSLGLREGVTLVVVMLPHEAIHEQASGLFEGARRTSARDPQRVHKRAPHRLTVCMPQPTVARVQNTPVTMEPFPKAAMVLMIPAEPVLGIPIRLSGEVVGWGAMPLSFYTRRCTDECTTLTSRH